ncbi:MAG: hypothetical protein H6662_10970 [Ardenticatenaceae bacterium]|nr:hypothetical protein [Anaerolineales bacterium]MCB8922096.1 hypothetical protein [Ardenticatenaceae bacterium]MCB9003212.1 hypothetical protein [Ardenticatenaceae bacterium]
MDSNNFQRVGSTSNTHVGRNFEITAKNYFQQHGISLDRNYAVRLGVNIKKKNRQFDLGSDDPSILVECKSHRWTQGGNIPSAKMTVWNEAMYYFYLAPKRFRKVLFVLHDFSEKRNETLAAYYVRNYGHLIPIDVEILEYNEISREVISIPTLAST